MNPATSKILYVDDDIDDREFFNLSFSESGSSANLICAANGEEAIQYLNSVSSTELPSLIILDLNMPKWDGRKTLGYIKEQPHLAQIPVVILSTSENSRDKAECTHLGAFSYFKKPWHLEGYKEIINCFMPLIKAE